MPLLRNYVELEAVLAERKPARYTPAGLKCVEASLQVEHPPQSAFKVDVVGFSEVAEALSKLELGASILCKARLQPASLNSKKLILSLDTVELIS